MHNITMYTFKIKTLKIHHVSIPYELSPGRKHQWNIFYIYVCNLCFLSEEDSLGVETWWSFNVLIVKSLFFFSMLFDPIRCRGLPYGASRSQCLDTPQSVGLLWASDRPDTEISTWQHNIHQRQISMSQAGFEPAIPASGPPQTHTLDRAANGIGF